jgi:hypothetical protein
MMLRTRTTTPEIAKAAITTGVSHEEEVEFSSVEFSSVEFSSVDNFVSSTTTCTNKFMTQVASSDCEHVAECVSPHGNVT